MKNVLLFLLLACAASSLATAAVILVPNGDFETAGNNGTIQGSLISGGVTATPLGTGPWSAKTSALASSIAPPAAIIGSGTARIAGLAGLGVVGQSNSAQFYQTLTGTTYSANTTYSLTVELTGPGLDLTLLRNNGIGIALTRGGNTNVVADSATDVLVFVSVLGVNTYSLNLQYLVGASAPAGDVGIRLYGGVGASLVTANLLGSITFDNISLTAIPEPATYATCAGLAILVGAFVSRRRRPV